MKEASPPAPCECNDGGVAAASVVAVVMVVDTPDGVLVTTRFFMALLPPAWKCVSECE